MRALVTGGAGFIGSNLVDRLLVEGHEVDVVDDFSTGSLSNLADARGNAGRTLTIHHLDIRPRRWWTSWSVADPTLSSIWRPSPMSGSRWPSPAFDAEVNIVGSLHILEGACQAEADRVVFAASGSTFYGEPAPDDLPVRESHPHQPLSPYGVSKKAVHRLSGGLPRLHSLEFSPWRWPTYTAPARTPWGGRRGRHLRRTLMRASR